MGSKGNIVRLVQVLTFNRRTIILIIVDKDCNAHRKKTQYKRKIRLFIKKKIFSHIARWGRGRGRNQTIQAKIRHILVRKQLWHFNRQFLRNINGPCIPVLIKPPDPIFFCKTNFMNNCESNF